MSSVSQGPASAVSDLQEIPEKASPEGDIMRTNAATMSRRRMLTTMPAAAVTVTGGTAAATADDPVLAPLAAHAAVCTEIAALDGAGVDHDKIVSAALQRHDELLLALLNTMPTTIDGLGRVLRHLSQAHVSNPDEPNILVSASDAGNPELSLAAETYLARLSRAVLAISNTRSHSRDR
jgi:hypothetical protein